MRARAKLAFWWLLFAAAAVVALWCHWPFLVREHQRLEPWKGVLIWSSEATGALVFLWFGLTHLVLGRPLPQSPAPETQLDREHLIIMVLFLLSLGCDGLVSWWAMTDEQEALARAVEVQGEIVGATRPTSAGNLVLECRFTDQRGDQYAVGFPLAGLGDHEAARRLRLGLFPIPIRIVYDPKWPDRSWLAELRDQRGDTLHDVSLVVLLMQIFVIPFVVFSKGTWQTEAGAVPLYKVLPLLVTTATLFGIGLVMRFIGHMV